MSLGKTKCDQQQLYPALRKAQQSNVKQEPTIYKCFKNSYKRLIKKKVKNNLKNNVEKLAFKIPKTIQFYLNI